MSKTVTVLNNTERLYILSAREYTRRSDGGNSKNDILHLFKLNLVPGFNTVAKSELDKIDRNYLDALVEKGDLEVGNVNEVGKVKPKKAKSEDEPKKRGRPSKLAVKSGEEGKVIGDNAPDGDAVQVVV